MPGASLRFLNRFASASFVPVSLSVRFLKAHPLPLHFRVTFAPTGAFVTVSVPDAGALSEAEARMCVDSMRRRRV